MFSKKSKSLTDLRVYTKILKIPIKAVKPDGEDRAFSDKEFYKLYNLTDDEIMYVSSL
ncbi:MAG: hypothetical protein LBF12_00095 [Christensenellaceae bacterium]|nr:hypothetical protein [Christensenellaceae bacterium]